MHGLFKMIKSLSEVNALTQKFFFRVVYKDYLSLPGVGGGPRHIPGGYGPPTLFLYSRMFFVTSNLHVLEDWVFLLYMCREKQNQFICHEFIL